MRKLKSIQLITCWFRISDPFPNFSAYLDVLDVSVISHFWTNQRRLMLETRRIDIKLSTVDALLDTHVSWIEEKHCNFHIDLSSLAAVNFWLFVVKGIQQTSTELIFHCINNHQAPFRGFLFGFSALHCLYALLVKVRIKANSFLS